MKKFETQGKHFDLLAFGEALVEFARLPDGSYRRAFAGDTLNTSYYASRLGLRTKYLTCFGKDFYTDELMRFIESIPVDISRCVRHPSRNNGLYTIEYDKNGKRQFTFWRDRSAAKELFSFIDNDIVQGSIKDASATLVSLIGLAIWDDPSSLLNSLKTAASLRCFDTNFRASLWSDTTLARKAVERAAEFTDILFVSSSDHHSLFGSDDPMKRYERLGFQNIIYRDEDAPVRYYVDGVEGEISAIPHVDIIDATGAGDAFNAGFLASYIGGKPVDQCVRIGICSASAAMLDIGGMAQNFSAVTVAALLSNVYGDTL